MTVTTAPVEVINLTAQDRCDRCAAQAYHLARKNELELLLCNHCETEHGPAMLGSGWVIITDQFRQL